MRHRSCPCHAVHGLALAAVLLLPLPGCLGVIYTYERGASFWEEGKVDRARECFARTVRRKPGHLGARVGLGLTLLMRKEPHRALEQFEAARRIDPRDPGPVIGIAIAHLLLEESVEAWEAVEDAERLAPDMPEVHVLRALSLCLEGKPDAAAASASRGLGAGARGEAAWRTIDLIARSGCARRAATAPAVATAPATATATAPAAER
jgi:Flp pilus assembly protein TadD